MLILNPQHLSLLGLDYSSIETVKVDRVAHRETIEWSDKGPHAVFADVPETRIEISIVQRLDGNEQPLDIPKPGQLGALEVITSPNSSQAKRKKLAAQCVVRSVRTEVGTRSTRTISLVAISADGAADPITLTDF